MLRHNARKYLRSLYVWHRYVGLSALLFAIMLAVTGVMLNHTEDLDLDRRFVDSDLLLNWYGIAPPEIQTAYHTGNHSITQIEDRLYMDRQPLAQPVAALHGATEASSLVAVAVERTIFLLTPGGEMVEQLGDAEGVPPGLRAIGRAQDGHLVIDTADGYYTTDENFLSWRPYRDTKGIVWSQPQSPSPELRQDVEQQYRSQILSVERVLLDLHTGRIFGAWGIYVVDAAAMLLVFLGLTGSWLWLQQYRKQRQHRSVRHPR
ncbi:MAG: PepSY domain-containing protein [Gammaproteobacteria bacterium]|nr:PepSY domain-containing protein [Gammaproteobacteria bacterium]MBA3731533.1 PepSY domain-containing protein [Gammaproteobacteria bacterium]